MIFNINPEYQQPDLHQEAVPLLDQINQARLILLSVDDAADLSARSISQHVFGTLSQASQLWPLSQSTAG